MAESMERCIGCDHTFMDHFHGHLGLGRNPERCQGGGCVCAKFVESGMARETRISNERAQELWERGLE